MERVYESQKPLLWGDAGGKVKGKMAKVNR